MYPILNKDTKNEKMKRIYMMSALALGMAIFASCKKDEVEPTPTTPTATAADVELKIEHTWAGAEFVLGTDLVNVHTGDTLNFTTFKYYISNIKLKKADGSWWSESNSYHLLDVSTMGSTTSLTLANVPAGEYTDVQYVLGVDSTKNVSGAQDGDLSPSKGMFWSWNTGYIMTKAEGTSPQAGMGSFAFHLGGFSGSNNIVTTKTHNFGSNSLTVNGTNHCQIHLSALPEELWSNGVSVATSSMIMMPGAGAKAMANAFYASFAFEHIHE